MLAIARHHKPNGKPLSRTGRHPIKSGLVNQKKELGGRTGGEGKPFAQGSTKGPHIKKNNQQTGGTMVKKNGNGSLKTKKKKKQKEGDLHWSHKEVGLTQKRCEKENGPFSSRGRLVQSFWGGGEVLLGKL